MDLTIDSPVRPPVTTICALFRVLQASVTALITPEAHTEIKLSSDGSEMKIIGGTLQVLAAFHLCLS